MMNVGERAAHERHAPPNLAHSRTRVKPQGRHVAGVNGAGDLVARASPGRIDSNREQMRGETAHANLWRHTEIDELDGAGAAGRRVQCAAHGPIALESQEPKRGIEHPSVPMRLEHIGRVTKAAQLGAVQRLFVRSFEHTEQVRPVRLKAAVAGSNRTNLDPRWRRWLSGLDCRSPAWGDTTRKIDQPTQTLEPGTLTRINDVVIVRVWQCLKQVDLVASLGGDPIRR